MGPRGGTNDSRRIALTFDDGPNPALTPQLLDLLDRHGAKATFFLIGRFVRECPELVREIAGRGHALGNHTDMHPNLVWLSRERIRQELSRCQEAIATAAATSPRWFRPPYGFRGPQLQGVVRRLDFAGVVMWTLIGYDWKPQPASQLIERLRPVRAGDLVCLHDGDHHALGGDRGHVLGALEHWLPRWRDAGLEFATMNAALPVQPRRG